MRRDMTVSLVEASDISSRLPKRLFKYLQSVRIDALENLRFRFTPLLGTNDIFEVRRTFKKLVGPKFSEIFEEQTQEINPEEEAIKLVVNEFGIEKQSAANLVRSFLSSRYGKDYNQNLRKFIGAQIRELVLPVMNLDTSIEQVLSNVGKNLLAFSLTEDPYSAPMWTHYAQEGRGFLVEFTTSHEFFIGPNKTSKFHKVHYFDGLLPELMDDVQKALISKTSDWSYEKEWRVFQKPENADLVLAGNPDPIHLFDVPASAITGVIFGYNIDPKFTSDLIAVARASVPHASIRRLVPNRLAGKFSEELL
jgi:hypothetical protein